MIHSKNGPTFRILYDKSLLIQEILYLMLFETKLSFRDKHSKTNQCKYFSSEVFTVLYEISEIIKP